MMPNLLTQKQTENKRSTTRLKRTILQYSINSALKCANMHSRAFVISIASIVNGKRKRYVNTTGNSLLTMIIGQVGKLALACC